VVALPRQRGAAGTRRAAGSCREFRLRLWPVLLRRRRLLLLLRRRRLW
jgi:hypothetical protein